MFLGEVDCLSGARGGGEGGWSRGVVLLARWLVCRYQCVRWRCMSCPFPKGLLWVVGVQVFGVPAFVGAHHAVTGP